MFVVIILLIINSFLVNIQSQQIHLLKFDTNINKLLITKNNDYLIVASENYLYKLNKQFEIENKLIIGPTYESISQCAYETAINKCISRGEYCINNTPINNNVYFMLNYGQNEFIECGSSYEGSCRIRDINTLQINGCNFTQPLIWYNYGGSGILGNLNRLYIMTNIRPLDRELYFLEDLNLINYYTLSGKTNVYFAPAAPYTSQMIVDRKTVNSQQIDIQNIFTFKSNGMIYFLYNHGEQAKVIRMCDLDTKEYVSRLVEISINCGNTVKKLKSADYSQKLDTIFMIFNDNSLCSIQVSYLNNEFKNAINSCLTFNDSLASLCLNTTDVFRSNKVQSCRCSFYRSKLSSFSDKLREILFNEPDFCYFNSKQNTDSQYLYDILAQLMFFNVRESINLQPYLKLSNEINSIITTELYDNKHLVFLAINNNKIRLFETKQNYFEELMQINVEFNPKILNYDHSNHILYVESEKRLMRIDLNDCSSYKTCSQCLLNKNPYCGWCLLDDKCLSKSKCLNTKWFQSFNSSSCPQIIQVQPKYLAPLVTNKIKLTVNFEIKENFKLKCLFNKSIEVDAMVIPDQNQIICEINKFYIDNNDYTNLLVELKSDLTGKVIGTSEEIFLVNCSYFNSCKKCQENVNYNVCSWDINNGKCIYSTSYNSNTSPNIRKCPQFDANEFINISFTQEKVDYYISLKNFDKISNFDLNCLLNNTYLTPFFISSNNSGYCSYSPKNDSQLTKVKFQYVYLKLVYHTENGNLNEIDYVYYPLKHVRINIVYCELNAANCGECLTDDLLSYGCGWCSSSSICNTQNLCSQNWLSRYSNGNFALCPDPLITSISPQCGPLEGGTQLKIKGINLGHTPSDVSVSLKSSLTTISCRLIDNLYVKASEIICKTNSIQRETNLSVLVTIKSDQQVHEISSFNQLNNQLFYRYAQYQVISISPTKTIKSGGTIIRLNGLNLNCGSNKQIFFGSIKCNIIEANDPDMILCKTEPFKENNFFNLRYIVDDSQLSYSNINLEYVNDPSVTSFSSNKSIISGGLVLKILGSSFDLIQNAILLLFNDYQNVSNKCIILNSTSIECITPKFTIISDYKLNLYLDGMDYARQNNNQFGLISVYQDPIFNETRFFRNNERKGFIEIRGENILLGSTKNDFQVKIGEKFECIIIDVQMNYITCELPDNESFIESTRIVSKDLLTRKQRDVYIVDFNSTDTLPIQIQIGYNFNQILGYLKYNYKPYDSVKIVNNESYDLIVIIVCSIGGLLFIILIICAILFKIRQDKSKKQLKFMQNEFENLEMRVANECKEAFTELQTDIDEFRSTLDQTGPPFNEFSTYIMHILFPKANESEKMFLIGKNEPITSLLKQENIKNGLHMFKQFILNKEYLIKLIDILAPEFTLNDRVFFASYLTICLHDQMAYFTEILLILSANLIEKSIQDKSIRMLFRRNESIAEKLVSYWFAFLLYDYIKESTGRPLYILFNSIKQQIYKGPVDSITYEAKYSLNQDKLIRQAINYEQLIVRVQIQSNDEQSHELHVKVLNCDTITQCKEKILESFYRGYPFSQRPHAEDFDLAYLPLKNQLMSTSSHVLLSDEDRSITKQDADFERINTLASYKITNGALLKLVHRQNFNFTFGTSNESNSYSNLDLAKNAENMTLLSKSSKGSSSPPTYSKSSTNIIGDYHTNTTFTSNYALDGIVNSRQIKKLNRYHLIKPVEILHTTNSSHTKKIDQTKLVSEIYLTRLLTTKGGIQSCIDDFFESVFSTTYNTCVLPYSIKYFFDFLDEQAQLHSINDDHVFHWKTNSLPLRFWTNIIQNPQFIFDIDKSPVVDSSLSIIAATFMDSCSQSSHELTKDSPSSKLLFYKDVQKYRKWVQSYYNEIRQASLIPHDRIFSFLDEESVKHLNEFNICYALYKLFNDYVKKNFSNIEERIKKEPLSVFNRNFIKDLHSIVLNMDSVEI